MPTAEGPDAAPPPAPAGRRSILFVCTGNTCRSPLAEAICKRVLADRLGCDPAELEGRGIVVRSAGVAAYHGDGPSDTAVRAAAEVGADLSAHRSRPVNPELLADATDVVTMTRSHAAVLAYRFPGVGPAPSLLCGPDDDLPDPIGGDLDVYRACTRVILGRLELLADGWLSDSTDHRPPTGDAGE
jgi:protein-tyrosine-phosphatase